MCFCHKALHMPFSPESSSKSIQISNTQLQRLSDTCWSCRYSVVDAVCSTFDLVLATLEELANGEDRSRAVEATGIWTQVQKFKYWCR